MSLKIEKQEKGLVTLTIEIPAEEVEKAITAAYNKIKHQITFPGFRKGKVPQKMVERQYGEDIFYEDAAEIIINNSYPEETKDCEVEIASTPEIEVVQIKKGEPFIYQAVVAVKPEVKLGTYKGVSYKKFDAEATDEDVQRELERMQEMNSRYVPVEDRPAENGDMVNIDFEGSVDGKVFDGGTATGHSITLGSHSFIDNFEEQIEGHNPGDEFDVNVAFPETYHVEELKGKPAVFKVKLNEIKKKELPELDDEFASEVSEFETLAEYKEDIKAKIKEDKEGAYRKAAEDEIIDKIVFTSDLEIPAPMLRDKINDVMKDYAARLENQGLSLAQYMQMVNQTEDDIKKEIEPMALADLKKRLVLEQIAKEENIEITDEDVEKEIEELAKAYQLSAEDFKKIIPDTAMDGFRDDIKVARAADLVYENGLAVEEKADDKKEDNKETAEEA